MKHRAACLIAVAAVAAVSACSAGSGSASGSSSPGGSVSVQLARPAKSSQPTAPAPTARAPAAARVPHVEPAHVLIVLEENHSYSDIASSRRARYLHSLAADGASLTQSFAITHPSQPNYVALFAGSTHRLSSDSCPHSFRGANLGSELRAAHRTFAGYAEDLPRGGYQGCSAGLYARKHSPWTDFTDLPRSVNKPLTALPHDFNRLPTLSFVVPDLDHDMHNGTIGEGDTWLKRNLGGYARWARAHNSLLIVTWDEDDRSERNRIPTIIYGAHVRPGRYSHRVDDYTVLRTLEWFYGLPALGRSAHKSPITGIWR